MPLALLLSPDDQAVSAITAVLEEMSVTCERPLDGVSAAHKLNSHSFDLVLVDCENLPAAKLIFDVCRRGKNGNKPIPIAIVDGRAGLPTAFRLGAELILTKPVAKDQARSTIRTAVSRVRKDVPANVTVPAQAAAAAVSSQQTGFAEPTPNFVPTSAASTGSTATLSAPALTTTMHSAVDEIDAASTANKLNPQSASFSASSLSESSSAGAVSENSRPAHPVKPSDDPVLAELEESELQEAQLESSRLDKATPDKLATESDAPVFTYAQSQQKNRGALVAMLMLALAASGFYAAWMYQPGFRAFAQPQIDRVLALAGMARQTQTVPPTPAPISAKPSGQVFAAATSAPAPQLPADPSKTPATATGPATGSVDNSAATSATAVAPVRPASAPGTAVAPPTSGVTATPAPVVTKFEVSKPPDSKPIDIKNDNKKDASATTSAGGQLPGENSPIVLSSQGAEKRLAYSVAPKYPVEARSGEAQGTVVLKEVVDENGKVASVRLVEGDVTLATAAIKAVKQWRYRPYLRDGKAQPFQTVVTVDFQRP